MQLGSILSSNPGEPMVSWPVEFYLLRFSPEGPKRVRVQALLLPVSEAERQRSNVEAMQFLRTDPNSPWRATEQTADNGEFHRYEGTDVSIGDEQIYKFLTYALHDAEDPSKRLVREIDYPVFRKGLVRAQVQWLHSEYTKLIEQEYPEIVSQKQKDKLVAEAQGK